jgi:hypothetical protein
VTSSVSEQHLGVEMRRVWGLERVHGRLCLPPCGVVGRQFWPTLNRWHSLLTDVGRIVAVPEAVLRTRALSRHSSPPVVGPGPSSSYAYQRLAAPAGVSGLELAAGVSVAVSAEIRLSVDRARAMSNRISICASNGSEDRGGQSYLSYATSSAAKSSNGPTDEHRVLR